MSSVPLRDLEVTDPFWSNWSRTLVDRALPHQFEKLMTTGRIANFRRVLGELEGDFEGFRFNDSDVYKWLEATAFALAQHPSQVLRDMYEQAVAIVERTQLPDGYINTFFQNGRIEKRLLNLNAMHEMYCLGHLIEASVAAKECLDDDRLYQIGVRAADFLVGTFGPTKRLGYCGHEEIELALYKLAKVSGEQKYADLATWMIEKRGHHPSIFEQELNDPAVRDMSPLAANMLVTRPTTKEVYVGEYAQDHAPIREHRAVVGHAIRAMYLYIAAAEMADGREDEGLETALIRCWDSLVKRRMYLTGGIGPSGHNEGFTKDFDLPNLTAYAETCAAIGLVFWGHAMLEQTGDGDYADVVERALYNGALSGISLDGDAYFYDNPLESRGEHSRKDWFSCACCPPNIARLIASVGRYAIGVADRDVYVHMPIGMNAKIEIEGVKGEISITGNYPWSGKFKIEPKFDRKVSLALRVRIPEWAEEVSTTLDGADEEATYDGGYAVFERTWSPGEKLIVEFEMEPVWVESNPMVRDNLGRVALTRGPLVYCAEAKDVGFAPQLYSVDVDAPTEIGPHPNFPDMFAIETSGMCEEEAFVDQLFAPVGMIDYRDATATFLPYFAWNNRGANAMQVWVRRR